MVEGNGKMVSMNSRQNHGVLVIRLVSTGSLVACCCSVNMVKTACRSMEDEEESDDSHQILYVERDHEAAIGRLRKATEEEHGE